MKSLLILIFLTISLFAGEPTPSDWEYAPYPYAPYSATIPNEDDSVAILVGTVSPSGLTIERGMYSLDEFKNILKDLVDSLVFGNELLAKPVSGKKRLKKIK